MHIIFDPKILKDLGKCVRKVNTWVWLGDLNKIQKHRHGVPFMLKMDPERNICLVVGGCPGVSCEIQSALVFL